VLAAVGGHLVYPALLGLATRGRRAQPPPDPDPWPPLSVVIPAYLEAGVIAQKIGDLRHNGYPGEIEIIVVADGDPRTAFAARAAGARTLESPDRLGKSQAINRGIADASHEIVVLTDANNHLVPGSLAAAVRWFGDPAIAAVAGEKIEADAGGEEAYWRFESWLKRREALLGITLGLVGELTLLRTAAFRPIPEHISVDDLWIALDLAGRGEHIAYEPEARSIDEPADSLRVQWERRTRIASTGLDAFFRRSELLMPSAGVVAAQIWGHRLWRYTAGPAAHLVLLGLSVHHRRDSRVAQAFLVGHAVGAGALVAKARGANLPKPLEAGAQLLFLQGVAVGGVVRYLRRENAVRWPKLER